MRVHIQTLEDRSSLRRLDPSPTVLAMRARVGKRAGSQPLITRTSSNTGPSSDNWLRIPRAPARRSERWSLLIQGRERGGGGGLSTHTVPEGNEIEVVKVWEVVDESDECAGSDITVLEGQTREGRSEGREYLESKRNV